MGSRKKKVKEVPVIKDVRSFYKALSLNDRIALKAFFNGGRRRVCPLVSMQQFLSSPGYLTYPSLTGRKVYSSLTTDWMIFWGYSHLTNPPLPI